MVANDKYGNCQICGEYDHLEGHHVVPVSYGGPQDGLMINICGNCHFRIHKMAEAFMSKKNKTVNNLFITDQLLKQASPYIKAIMDAKRRKEDGEVDIYKPRRKMIVVNLSDYEWERIKKISRDQGFTNTLEFIENFLRKITKF